MRQVFLDTETTGLFAEGGDRVIEIGCVELVNRRFTGNNRHYYLNPERDSHAEALKVHGISNEFLRDKPLFAAIADELQTYLQGCEIIIHNAPFDVGFLDHELARLGRTPMAQWVHKITDTLALAKERYPGKRNSLDALCARLEVDNSARTVHGALVDAELLAEVYLRMTRGQDALAIDPGADMADSHASAADDLRALDIPVLMADADELLAHEDVLKGIDKESGSKTVWRQAVA